METTAELGRESRAERSCQTTEQKKAADVYMQLFTSTLPPGQIIPTHLYGALVVVGNVQEHGMGNTGHERAQTGLVESSDRLASVPVHQSALFVAVASRHGLCRPRRAKMSLTLLSARADAANTSNLTRAPHSNLRGRSYIQLNSGTNAGFCQPAGDGTSDERCDA